MNWLGLEAPTAPAEPGDTPTSFAWATVTSTGPLRIQVDGQSIPLPITPDTLVGSLVADDRVWIQKYGKRVIVLGRAGG